MRSVSMVVMLLLALAGCTDRTHSWPAYGQAYRTAFKTQVINPDAGTGVTPDPGLDPEEAGAVAGSYVRSLTRLKDEKNSQQQILVVEPPKAKSGSEGGSK